MKKSILQSTLPSYAMYTSQRRQKVSQNIQLNWDRGGMYVCKLLSLWYNLVWYGIIWFGMVWYGLVWFWMPEQRGLLNSNANAF